MKKIYEVLKEAVGLKHPYTLNAMFSYYDELIGLYKLTECDALLTEATPICKCMRLCSFLSLHAHRLRPYHYSSFIVLHALLARDERLCFLGGRVAHCVLSELARVLF